MKVAFIVEKFPNVSETFILDEIVGLIQRGIDVTVYAYQRGSDADVHPAYETYRLLERTRYCVPRHQARVLRIAAAFPATYKMLVRKPAAFMKCALSRKRGVEARTFVSLGRAFVNSCERYDIVHAHFGPNGIRAEVLRRAGALHAPLITTFHGYDVSSFVKNHGTSVYTDLARHGDRFIAVSNSISDELQRIGFPSERTHVMPLGVDSRSFTPKIVDGVKRNVRLISIGRFVEKKGFEYGIRAVVEAHKKNSGISYDIIGDGALRLPLEALIHQFHAGSFIKLHGYKNQRDIKVMLAQSDIMLLPSVTSAGGDHEGMPIVAKEAMASGLPVVASRHAGIPEIVADGSTGLLAAERDVEALARHLLSLADDRDKREEFGRTGRAVIESQYDNVRLIDDLIALYRRVAATSSYSGANR